jgi:CheY-like chemotaxis protein
LVDVPNVTVAEALQTSDSIGQFDELAGTILYIEDNASNISLLTEIFAPFKTIELVCARDAETGLTVAAEIEPAIVIFDIHLPGMNGIEALQQLRKIAAATRAERQRGLDAGFSAYLTKPVPITELLAELS